MNWKLVGLLSLFGVAMGLGLVFFIPSNIEPILWLVIFVFSGYQIAKHCPKRRFLHGLLVGLFDSLLKTTTHLSLLSVYLARHQQEIAMIRKMTSAVTPVQLIVLTAPVWGLIYGVVTGLLAVLAASLIKAKQRAKSTGVNA
jgi:predicted membrane-bound dolichyl-phosphate-mannose-protein mannosyltransferase